MALFNYATKEITLKVVYYGPGLSGKTTNLQKLHSVLEPQKTGKLLSLATETDRTLFFDFLPVELGKVKEFSIRFQLYTVPGQVKYNATRKVVLKGSDAIVFVADSQKEMREANMASFANMKENLIANNINLDDITLVLQYNKRDLPDILSIDELNEDLNSNGDVYLEAEAINSKGVHETFQTATKLLIKDITLKHKLEIQPAAPLQEPASAGVTREISEEEKEPVIPITPEEISDEKEKLIGDEAVFSPAYFQGIDIKEKEKITEEKMPGLPEIKEVPAYHADQINRMAESLRETNQLLISIKAAIKGLSDELRGVKEEHKEMLSIIRELEISEAAGKLRERKRKGWFGL